ncbi:MAG: DNA primase [Desulfuromonadales bacterium]|nr:DNA primase [Desulfuromonadales bacterium]
MAGLIADETIERIRERVDIVELISSYLPLKRSGGNYQGLCPFHGEKTPSFNVNPARQIFHCFGCGVGGNSVSFVMKMEGLSFPDAVRRLGSRVGIVVEEEAPTAEQSQRREQMTRFLRVMETAATAYERVLLKEEAGGRGRDYLKERGYASETAKLFHLGYAPEQSDFLCIELEAAGVEMRDAEELGLVRSGTSRPGRYDLLRNRLIFPIQDERGRIVAFGGRAIGDAQPKYLNSPESLLYHKGQILYGLFQAKEAMRRSSEAIIVEGYFDLLALHRAGLTHTVAPCGTALTTEQARLIKRFASRVFLLFDQDSAGQKANQRAMEIFLAEGVSPLIVTLDAGDDPDSYLRKQGAEAMRERLAAAQPALELFIDATLKTSGESIEGRARGAEKVLPLIKLLPSEMERNLYLKALAKRTGIDEQLLLRSRPVAAGSPSPHPARPPQLPPLPRSRERLPGSERVEKAQDLILHLFLQGRLDKAQLEQDGIETLFPDPQRREIVQAALAFSVKGEHIDSTRLFDALEVGPQSILSGILLKEDRGVVDDLAGQTYDDCRMTLRKDALQRRSRELTECVRQAELAGDLAGTAAFQQEQIQLNRQLKSGKIF